MYSQKANSSAQKIGQKMMASGNTLGKKTSKYMTYKPTKDGQNLFNHSAEKRSPLERR
jgi:hypothetical protein